MSRAYIEPSDLKVGHHLRFRRNGHLIEGQVMSVIEPTDRLYEGGAVLLTPKGERHYYAFVGEITDVEITEPAHG